MKAISNSDVLEAAAYALVSGRCRESYIHDMRGELQALQSAVELMVRAAKSPGENGAIAERASALAKRTMANYERSIIELLDQMAPQPEVASIVNVGELVSAVLRFVRNDASSKSVSFCFNSVPDVCINAEARKFRLLILGLLTLTIDGVSPGAVVEVTVAQTETEALLDFKSDMPCAEVLTTEDLWQAAQPRLPPYQLLLALAHQWTAANGGRLELASRGELPNVLRIYYPRALNS